MVLALEISKFLFRNDLGLSFLESIKRKMNSGDDLGKIALAGPKMRYFGAWLGVSDVLGVFG